MNGATTLRNFITLSVIVLMTLPAVAQAAEPPCLTTSEFTALSTYALPSVVAGATQRCAATLPRGAWLTRNGTQLSARYATAQSANWPAAKAAFLKLSGSSNQDAANVLKSMPDESQRQMADGFISGIVGQQLPTERCTAVDSLLRLLSPLPPQNTAEIIAVGAGLVSRSGRSKIGPLTICPAA
jgi:hypothetical protein